MAKHSKYGSCGVNIGNGAIGHVHDNADDADALHLDDIKIGSYPNAQDWEDEINGVPFRCSSPRLSLVAQLRGERAKVTTR